MAFDRSTRALDHIVLPVTSVERARARFAALGFTVAPTGGHPFGTENCCIFLGNDTFIEPLAVAKRETVEAAMVGGNTFLLNDDAYRFRRDVEGFSHVVLKTDNAAADHEAFRDRAMSGGDMVRFERAFALPDRSEGKASFALAFARDHRAPDANYFTCEVVDAPQVDRAPLLDHPNGALALTEIVTSEPNPSDFQYFLQRFLRRREMDNHSFGIEFALPNAKTSVLTPAGMRAFCGLETDEGRGLLHQTFVVAVRDLDALTERYADADIETVRIGQRILVPWAPGQGCPILFEQENA